jgi:hypothetical protein
VRTAGELERDRDIVREWRGEIARITDFEISLHPDGNAVVVKRQLVTNKRGNGGVDKT